MEGLKYNKEGKEDSKNRKENITADLTKIK